MEKAKIHVDYYASLAIVKEGITNKILNSYHHGWDKVGQEESPFKDWIEPMICWYAEPSCIYIGILSKESFDKRKDNTVFLHVYNNVPMWNMEKEIKGLVNQIGISEAELVLPNYVRAVAQGALRLLEFNG